MPKTHIRKDIEELSPEERDLVVRAFHHIKNLEPEDPNSFFTIAGYHGLPEPIFCRHASVLFPTWHRAYLLRLENALRTAPGCANLALPYWNETSQRTLEQGLPKIFTDESYDFVDGTSIPNPLFSYKMQQAVDGGSKGKDNAKPVGYNTVRYPYSGLVSADFAEKTKIHNETVDSLGPGKPTALLNENVTRWLTFQRFENHKGEIIYAGEADNFKQCLDAPNYTVFSNVKSAEIYNNLNKGSPHTPTVVSLEHPHNSMHLAIGGFEVPSKEDTKNVFPFANGDMGENDTAAFDPVFYFHHCFIDYMFWKWQDIHNKTTELDIIPKYISFEKFNLDTALEPFKITDPTNGKERFITSKDVVDTTKLGYEYPRPRGHGLVRTPAPVDAPKVAVTGINRSKIRGSFIVSTWAKGQNGEPDRLIDTKAVLSRWAVGDCDNCQNYLNIQSHTQLNDYTHEDAQDAEFYALIHTREKPEGFDTVAGMPVEVELNAVRN
ncbi:uncharacterized protein CTRU02_204476 [Colletotrichum truncatum]|uniref:Uncharacterized protein n=1 Tax=Colletotrichum truncatum TaxID=5467 RepID=A0ACC3ZC40_COLTU|nr:uncharacterized protein CTRU02_02705 [Colletotrichum truncatum]KAF6797663.1 hypothetical protein CTRU02_02705 [Colletotrichum truncatum]